MIVFRPSGGDSGFISTSKAIDVDEDVSEETGDDKYLRTRGKPVCTIGMSGSYNYVYDGNKIYIFAWACMFLYSFLKL